MISVSEAKQIIQKHPLPKWVVKRSLMEASGKVLAEDVLALSDIPRFDNSAMDGYAVKSKDTEGIGPHCEKTLTLIGEVRAGDFTQAKIKQGEVMRIMTGAMIPQGADAVVMREFTREEENQVLIEKEVKLGENIRRKGEEIVPGAVALQKRTVLNPAALGFLASVGLKEVKVFDSPKVALIVTGNELVDSLDSIQPGQILESNSVALKAALSNDGISVSLLEIVPDDPGSLNQAIEQALKESDCLLVLGGVSVGNYDFTKEVLQKVGVKDLFWRVAQKPGKPLFFGQIGEKTIFGLPGNPASVLVCFYEYVRPHLREALGFSSPSPSSLRAKFIGKTKKKEGFTYFARAQLRFNNRQPEVTLIEGQESFRMGSFAQANVLAVLPEEKNEICDGDNVEVHLLK